MNEPRKRNKPKRDKRDNATRLADYVSSLKTNNPKLTPPEIANLLEISPFHSPGANSWSATAVTKLLDQNRHEGHAKFIAEVPNEL